MAERRRADGSEAASGDLFAHFGVALTPAAAAALPATPAAPCPVCAWHCAALPCPICGHAEDEAAPPPRAARRRRDP